MENATRRLLIIIASIMVSFSAPLYRVSESAPMVMVFYRMLFASLIVIPLAVWECRGKLPEIDRKDTLLAVVAGVVFAIHLAAYFGSLDHISIASSLVLTDTAVFFIAIFMMVFFRESISVKGWGIMALTFGGCVIISISDMDLGSGLTGDALALLSSLLFAAYAIIGRRVRGRVSTFVYTSILYISATVTSLVIVGIDDIASLNCGPKDILCGLGLAVFCTILGHTVYNWGFRYESAAFVAITTLLEPVFGTILGFVFFGEVPGSLVIIGSVIVLLGVYLFSVHTAPPENGKFGKTKTM